MAKKTGDEKKGKYRMTKEPLGRQLREEMGRPEGPRATRDTPSSIPRAKRYKKYKKKKGIGKDPLAHAPRGKAPMKKAATFEKKEGKLATNVGPKPSAPSKKKARLKVKKKEVTYDASGAKTVTKTKTKTKPARR